MESLQILDLFQGLKTMLSQEPTMVFARLFLVFLGGLMMYLGKKGVLEPLLMIPMGLGMAVVNMATMMFDPLALHGGFGNLFIEPQAGAALSSAATAGADMAKQAANAAAVSDLFTILQIDFLQPIYTFTFSNGLIAIFVFMGIGSLLDIGYVIARPFMSMTIALFAELGSILTLPIAEAMGLTTKQAAAVATVGGADGPMVLFTSLKLAPELFVPIAVVAYLYLGLAYGVFPFVVRALIPKKLRAIQMKPSTNVSAISPGKKMTIAFVAVVVLSFLLPVAAPLLFALFLGIIIRESGVKQFVDLLQGPVLYMSTFFLGTLLGVLCDAGTIMDPKVLPLLGLGMMALLISAVGGIIGGYFMWFVSGGKINPVIGIAGVSCVPTTAKVAQKIVSKDNPQSIVLPDALGVNVAGVLTSALIAGVFVSLLMGK